MSEVRWNRLTAARSRALAARHAVADTVVRDPRAAQESPHTVRHHLD
ncbi:hypothetical protein ACF1GW_29130 [Streptomyces achromogenes]